jgi:NitT/TauT family transport system ATP-binding protein
LGAPPIVSLGRRTLDMNEKLTVRALCKRFTTGARSFDALLNISFSVAPGEFVAFVGASGCGKSTLLRIIAGLEPISRGEVLVDERPISGTDRDRAMVFQDYSLYPWLTVLENIRFSSRLAANRGDNTEDSRSTSSERSLLLLELMGLGPVRDAHPHALSGGMRQRVAIARALLSKPQLLLMDEPFGALDAQTREVMHDLILHILALEKRTILFVTHDVEEAVYLADRVIVLAPAPGRIDSIWRIDLPPALERTQDLKRSPEFLDVERRILDRIRATSGLQSDLDALHRLTAQVARGDASSTTPL